MSRSAFVVSGRHRALGVLGGLVLGIVAAACSSAPSASGRSAPTRSERATIAANWRKFFSGTTPAAAKLPLLQDASAFASVVHEQASLSLAKQASAKVTRVRVHGDRASVRYTIDLGGVPALKNQTGTAVLKDGTWKVADVSFCALLALEGAETAACTSS